MTLDRLFYPVPALPGILKCAKCDELFISAAWIRDLLRDLKAEGTVTNWLPTAQAETARRRAHGQHHVRRTEATYADDGYFRIRVEPTPTTALDFGFSR